MSLFIRKTCVCLSLSAVYIVMFSVQVKPLVWSLEELENVVLSHSESLNNVQDYFRKMEYFWKWFTRNEKKLKILLKDKKEKTDQKRDKYFEELNTKLKETEKSHKKEMSNLMQQIYEDRNRTDNQIIVLQDQVATLQTELQELKTNYRVSQNNNTNFRNKMMQFSQTITDIANKSIEEYKKQSIDCCSQRERLKFEESHDEDIRNLNASLVAGNDVTISYGELEDTQPWNIANLNNYEMKNKFKNTYKNLIKEVIDLKFKTSRDLEKMKKQINQLEHELRILSENGFDGKLFSRKNGEATPKSLNKFNNSDVTPTLINMFNNSDFTLTSQDLHLLSSTADPWNETVSLDIEKEPQSTIIFKRDKLLTTDKSSSTSDTESVSSETVDHPLSPEQ